MKRGSIELPLFSCLIVTDGTRKMYLQCKNHIPDRQEKPLKPTMSCYRQ